MARKRGGLAGIYDRNRGLIQAAAPLAASFGVAGLRKLFSGGQEPEMGIPSLPPPPFDQGTGEAPMFEQAETVPQPKMPQIDPSRLQMSAIAQQQAAKAATPRPAPRSQGGGLGAAARRVASAAIPPSAAPGAAPSMARMAAGLEPGMGRVITPQEQENMSFDELRRRGMVAGMGETVPDTSAAPMPPAASSRPMMSGRERRAVSQMLGARPGEMFAPEQFQTATRSFTGPALAGEPFQALGQGGNPQAGMTPQMAPGLIDYLMASNPQLFGRAGASTLNRQRGFRR